MDQEVLVCENSPVHSRFDLAAQEHGFNLLRLGPYSPMLNPIENVWSVVKAHIKRFNRVPVVEGSGVINQRLEYLERICLEVIQEISP